MTTKTDRKAIKAKEDQEKTDILTGIISNDDKTYTFEAEITVDNKVRKGQFVAKFMTVTGRLRLGTIRAKLLDGAPAQSIDALTDDIAYMIAYLQVSLIKTPEWFNWDGIDNEQDLRKMFMEVVEFNNRFRNQDEQASDAGDSSDTPSTKVVENS